MSLRELGRGENDVKGSLVKECNACVRCRINMQHGSLSNGGSWNPKLTLKVNGLWIKLKAQNCASQVFSKHTFTIWRKKGIYFFDHRGVLNVLADRRRQGWRATVYHLRARGFVPGCSRKEPALLSRKEHPVSRLTLEHKRERGIARWSRETTLHPTGSLCSSPLARVTQRWACSQARGGT